MDAMVTIAQGVWLGWLCEGTLPGEASPEEWALFFGSGRGQKPPPPTNLFPGDRVYVAAFGFIRGYAPLLRIEPTSSGYALVRAGNAVACTPWGESGPLPAPGFQGVRYRPWRRECERPFPDWMTLGLPAKLAAEVVRFQKLREQPGAREVMTERALRGAHKAVELFASMPAVPR